MNVANIKKFHKLYMSEGLFKNLSIFICMCYLGGLFSPCDGHIDPYSLTQAIAIGARKYGAKLQQKTEVTKLDLKEDGSWDVGTNQGTLNAGLVINAGGFWAKEIGKLSGLDLPLVPMQVCTYLNG